MKKCIHDKTRLENCGECEITIEDYTDILVEIIREDPHCVFEIPGVFDVLSEKFDKEIFERWEDYQYIFE